MGKKKKKGGRRKTKAPIIRTAAKVGTVAVGASVLSKADITGLIKFALDNPNKVPTVAFGKALLVRAGPGVALILGGPPAVDIVYKALPLPEVKRATVPGSNRKWV